MVIKKLLFIRSWNYNKSYRKVGTLFFFNHYSTQWRNAFWLWDLQIFVYYLFHEMQIPVSSSPSNVFYYYIGKLLAKSSRCQFTMSDQNIRHECGQKGIPGNTTHSNILANPSRADNTSLVRKW